MAPPGCGTNPPAPTAIAATPPSQRQIRSGSVPMME